MGEYIAFVLYALLFAYAITFLFYTFGWLKATKAPLSLKNPETSVSVVVAVRNEENTVKNLLHCLAAQKYPNELFEILIVDDASTDNTAKKIDVFIKETPTLPIKRIFLEEVSPNPSPKKRALAQGITLAKGKLILTTDADCILGENWMASIVNCYENTNGKMIVSPVIFHREKTIFEKIQSLEFMSLVGCGGASLSLSLPLMCNGANLAYEKGAFDDAGGFLSHMNVASGDDIFLMQAIHQRHPGSVLFCGDKNAIVKTTACSTISAFVAQRRRWASKSLYYKQFYIYLIAALVYLINLSLLISIAFSIFSNRFVPAFWYILIVKSCIDFIFLVPVSNFFEKKRLLIFLLPLQPFYALYISISGILALFGSYQWKGRTVR